MQTEAQSEPNTETERAGGSIWMRGLIMLVFLILYSIAETLLAVLTVIQWFWAVITGSPNAAITDLGVIMGEWTRDVARFQTFKTEERPFPWGPLPKA